MRRVSDHRHWTRGQSAAFRTARSRSSPFEVLFPIDAATGELHTSRPRLGGRSSPQDARCQRGRSPVARTPRDRLRRAGCGVAGHSLTSSGVSALGDTWFGAVRTRTGDVVGPRRRYLASALVLRWWIEPMASRQLAKPLGTQFAASEGLRVFCGEPASCTPRRRPAGVSSMWEAHAQPEDVAPVLPQCRSGDARCSVWHRPPSRGEAHAAGSRRSTRPHPRSGIRPERSHPVACERTWTHAPDS